MNSLLSGMRTLTLLLFIGVLASNQAQVSIKGYAPQFKNQTFYVSAIEDHLSHFPTVLQKVSIDTNGFFRTTIPINQITKIRIGNALFSGFMYVQPKARYTIDFISQNEENIRFNRKEDIEFTFYNLDSTDINYKILGFQQWMDSYIAEVYPLKDLNTAEFVTRIMWFKNEVNKAYKTDTCSFFKTYRRYSIGQAMDNLGYLGAPSPEDKYTQYLKNQPVALRSDAYMEFFKSFYDQFVYTLEPTLGNKLFSALVNNSIKKADSLLSLTPFCSNPELRYLVLTYLVKQSEYNKFLPRTTIQANLTVLSQVNPYLPQRILAKNILDKFNRLMVGEEFMPLRLIHGKDTLRIQPEKNKGIYIHAFDPTKSSSLAQLSALLKLHQQYGKQISFYTLYVEPPTMDEGVERSLRQITWPKIGLSASDPMWETLGIVKFPQYLLVDQSFTLVASPALEPTPNNAYETVEKSFYQLLRP
ncbi:MAG: hypothetical protein ACKO4K_07845 [Flavobacteriales bacterium]